MRHGTRYRDPEERFWEKVNRAPGLGPKGVCWEWTAGCSGDGYGAFKADGKQWGAHRWVFTRYVRPLAVGEQALHRCDNPICVNYVACLYAGTHRDNMDDSIASGAVAGLRNGRAILTPADARAIRAVCTPGPGVVRTMEALADEYGVSASAIAHIVYDRHWTKTYEQGGR